MAFANLFSKLCASHEDDRTPEQPAFTHRNNSEGGTKGKKRKIEAEQSDLNKKRCNQGQRSFNNGNFKSNVNKKRQHERKTEGRLWKKRGRHADADGGRKSGKGGGGNEKNQFRDKQDVKKKRSCFMSQEFKDLNALLVDGRLICRHFLWGRCIKADECQLAHIQGHNDLLKEVCKFYVQGFCTKGDTCPYMHKSFPCKFFHRKGSCLQGADCKFSHEPLTDLTKRLFEETLKRESDLYELAKKDQQETSGQPADAESEIKEAKKTSDLLLQPLRPNFYNSTAEKESCQTGEQEEDISPQTPSDAAQPPSATPNSEEPVCYSVEAVLGSQLSRPFFSFFTAPGSQDYVSDPQTVSGDTENKMEAPYSVDAVLRSCKSVENSTFDTSPTVKTVSYYPSTDSEKVTDPLLNHSERKSLKTKDEVNKETLSSVESSAVVEAEKSASSKHKDMKGSTHLPADTMTSVSSDRHAGFGTTEAKLSEQICASKHHTEVKPHILAQTVDSRSSVNPFSEVKAGERYDSNSHHLAAKRLGVISKKTQYGLKGQTKHLKSEKIPAECSRKTTDAANKRHFQSLFAGLITDDTVTLTPDCVTEPPQSAGDTGKVINEEKPSATSFLSLFSAPLTETAATPPPLSPDSRQRASGSKPPLPHHVRTDIQHSPPPEVSLDISDTLAEVSGPAQQQLPDISSPGANSVLTSLFLCLSPYQEDRGQQRPSENKTERNSMGCDSVKQQRKKRKGQKKKKKKKKVQDSDKQYSSSMPENQPICQGPPLPPLAAGGSTLSCPGMTEAQVRNYGAHHLPFKPTTPHTRLRQTTEETPWVNGSPMMTPLKDLFKTLDTSVFQKGH